MLAAAWVQVAGHGAYSMPAMGCFYSTAMHSQCCNMKVLCQTMLTMLTTVQLLGSLLTLLSTVSQEALQECCYTPWHAPVAGHAEDSAGQAWSHPQTGPARSHGKLVQMKMN